MLHSFKSLFKFNIFISYLFNKLIIYIVHRFTFSYLSHKSRHIAIYYKIKTYINLKLIMKFKKIFNRYSLKKLVKFVTKSDGNRSLRWMGQYCIICLKITINYYEQKKKTIIIEF